MPAFANAPQLQDDEPKRAAFALYSDDAGKSWRGQQIDVNTNETKSLNFPMAG